MDEQRSTSSVGSSSKKYEYDVFLSFRGEDTCKTFTSHLDRALNKKKIKTFIDDQLEEGDEISKALIKAIEDSRISIVIFSKNYASSKWCLNELSKIMECKRLQEQAVIPVFYDVDPSDVRKQTGNYKKAFAKYKGDSRCDQWKMDLIEAANIVGWDSKNWKNEPELLEVIVEAVLKKLVPKYPYHCDGLVGIDNSFEEIKSLLKFGSNDSDKVLTLGIWGMGGIGKTTLANALYENLSHKFKRCCFLKNVREKSENLEALHQQLYFTLSGEECHKFEILDLRKLLQHKRVFIVLDDVATYMQLEELIYQFYPLGLGSRVIVTTRYRHIFRLDAVIYSIKELSFHHSVELFYLTAFEGKQPKDGYEDISKKVISYCGGIPLALKVVGASLRSKSKEVWECKLNKPQSIPDMEIQKALKLSYDDLDHSQQSIFLDIACFFKGKSRDSMFPISDIEVLCDKSLITILNHEEKIEMHDLLQEMGYEIVHQQSIKYPERRSRLWKHKEVINALKRNEHNDVVEGIILNLSNLNENLNLSSDFLANMTSLRILIIQKWKESFNIYLPKGLNSFLNKLEYLEWEKCSLKSLSSNFCGQQLVVLRMHFSELKNLWNGVQNLENLKEIDLLHSKDLTHFPDLSKAEKLERVNLRGCESLHQPHPFILSAPKLRYLNLRGCREIKSLNIHSKYLEELNLNKCSSLNEISVASKEISELTLSFAAITSLPSSITSLPKLTFLNLSYCDKIERLDLHSKFLRTLLLKGCSSMKEISVASEEIVELDLRCTAITSLTPLISSLHKRESLRSLNKSLRFWRDQSFYHLPCLP